MEKRDLIQEIGYVYDLMFIFFAKFNSELFLSRTDAELLDDVKRGIDALPEKFGEVADDLYIFFHTAEYGDTFFIKYYFERYAESFDNGYDIRFVISELQNKEELKRNIIRHYFSDLNDAETEKCMSDNTAVFDCIKRSNYSGEEKSRLYEFFIKPDDYMDLLVYELSLKDIALSKYYDKNYHKALTVSEKVSAEFMREHFKLTSDAEIKYSFCLLNKYLIYLCTYRNRKNAFLVLGTEYQQSLDFFVGRQIGQDLNTLGEMLAEKNRVNILEFIMKRGEITRKDIESEFSFSGSTAYHHLSAMLRAGMILSRSNGKTMLYRVNKKYFDMAIDLLSIYSSNNCRGGKKCQNNTRNSLI